MSTEGIGTFPQTFAGGASRTTSRPPAQSPARVAIERLLRRATPEHPLTPDALAQLTGFGLAEVRTVINTMHGRCLIDNVSEQKIGRPAYAWASRPAPAPASERGWLTRPPYDGADLLRAPARSGSLDAFTLPSLQGGRSVERARPLSIATHVEEARRR